MHVNYPIESVETYSEVKTLVQLILSLMSHIASYELSTTTLAST